MFDHDRDFPRAYTVPGVPHKAASTLWVKWALEQAEKLGSSLSLYAPGKQSLRHVAQDHPAVHTLIQRGVRVTTWRDFGSGSGVVVALRPDQEHLLEADESGSTRELVAGHVETPGRHLRGRKPRMPSPSAVPAPTSVQHGPLSPSLPR